MSIALKSDGVCEIDGKAFPAMGFGTYPYQGEVCQRAVANAARVGYRIIDTATYYGNFKPIGEALAQFGRENFYIISKVWHDSLTPPKVKEDLNSTLRQLKSDYLDAYLIHWPNSQVPIEKTLEAMESARQAGKVRHIGVSNFTVAHMQRALEVGVPLNWVQIEMHCQYYPADLLDFCAEHNISVQAWTPLARGRLDNDPLIKKIAAKHRKTVSQVALKWILQHNALPLPGSQSEKHMLENLNVFDFTLTPQDMEAIDTQAKKGKRFRIRPDFSLGFADEFDFTYQQCWPKVKV